MCSAEHKCKLWECLAGPFVRKSIQTRQMVSGLNNLYFVFHPSPNCNECQRVAGQSLWGIFSITIFTLTQLLESHIKRYSGHPLYIFFVCIKSIFYTNHGHLLFSDSYQIKKKATLLCQCINYSLVNHQWRAIC